MIDLSIVLITYKMKDMLQKLLESVYTHSAGFIFEIIVIDNASKDGTVEMITTEFPACILIQNSENKGVAPARNQGFRIAKGRYVLTLDADMLLVENSLKVLFDFMESHPEVGLSGCRLMFEDGSIQPSGRRYPSMPTLFMRRLDFLSVVRNSRQLRHHEMADWDRTYSRDVDYLIGACQFIRRSAMDEIGMLDEHIFYGPEDLDYCLRMYRGGWMVYYVADTSIIHFEQRITRKKVFSKLMWKHLKGVIYIYKKYGGKLTRDPK